MSTILEELENITNGNNGLRSGDLLTSSAVLNDIAKYVTEHKDTLTVGQIQVSYACNTLSIRDVDMEQYRIRIQTKPSSITIFLDSSNYIEL